MSNIQLKNTDYKHNLDMLVNRQQGELFSVDAKGQIQRVQGIWNRIVYFFNRKEIQAGVKLAITQTIQSIEFKDEQRAEIRELFFETLKPLSLNVFDRGILTDECESFLCTYTAKSELSLKIQKVIFALAIGVPMEPIAEGQNGTYFGVDRKGKKLVVFKPHNEGVVSKKNPKLIAKIKRVVFKLFPNLFPHENIKRRCGYLNETGASAVDRNIKTDVVPETNWTYLGGKKGSCQSYVDNAQMAADVLDLPSFNFLLIFKRTFQKMYLKLNAHRYPPIIAQEQLERVAILQFVIGVQDGNLNNLLVKNKKGYSIDHTDSFPFKTPERSFSTVNQYMWKHLEQAKQSFSQSSKDLVNNIDEKPLFEELIKEMSDDKLVGFDDAQQKEMERRIKVLKAVVNQDMSMQYLGSIKTEADFERAFIELKLS